jgi:hypothetical protein
VIELARTTPAPREHVGSTVVAVHAVHGSGRRVRDTVNSGRDAAVALRVGL